MAKRDEPVSKEFDLFGSDLNYPTISKLKEFVNSKRASNFTVDYDSIKIVPARRTGVV